MIPLSTLLIQEIDSSIMCDSIKNILCQEVDPDNMNESIMNTFTSRMQDKQKSGEIYISR